VEEEWKAVADHVRLLKDCGSQILVYGECGLMTGASPWDEPLSKHPDLKEREFSAYADKLGDLQLPVTGTSDFSAIEDFVRTSGYCGWVVVEAEQDPAKAPPRVYAQKAYNYVTQLRS